MGVIFLFEGGLFGGRRRSGGCRGFMVVTFVVIVIVVVVVAVVDFGTGLWFSVVTWRFHDGYYFVCNNAGRAGCSAAATKCQSHCCCV